VVLVLWLAATYLVPLWSRRWIGPTIVAGAGSALFLTLVALGPARAPASWLGVACAVLVANGLGLWSAARVEQLQRLERAHVASERKYRRLVEGANSAIVHFDTHGVIRFANGYCQRFFGYDEDELVGHNLMGTIVPPSPTFSADMDRLMQDVQQQPDKYLVSESENMRKDGRRVWLSWSNRAIRDERGQLIEILSVGHDITPRKELERELRRLATSDPLTGAANRRRIVDRATRELQRSRRYDRPLSLLMLDIDHFKRINDRHGHDVGDRVLVRFVEACSAELREDDIIARIGGEEFAVLLPEADLETANAVGERLRATAAEIRIDEPVVRITVSVGVADFGDADEDCQGAFKRADEALYRAKEQGRDRVVAATSAHGQRS